MDPANRLVRYWLSGDFAAGDVTVTFLPQTWSYTQTGSLASPTTLTITDGKFMNVTFPAAPAGR